MPSEPETAELHSPAVSRSTKRESTNNSVGRKPSEEREAWMNADLCGLVVAEFRIWWST